MGGRVEIGINTMINYRLSQKLKLSRNGDLGPVWSVYLKTENCCLKTFIEIRVGEKVR